MRQFERPDGYVVYEDGTIYSPRGKLLKQTPQGRGYIVVTLNGKTKLLHRVIAEAFIPNPENKPTVNHKDGAKSNNEAGNLEWATYAENMSHGFSLGLHKKGSRHHYAKLSEEDIASIREEHKDCYPGWQRVAAKKYGVSQPTISMLVNGLTHPRAY